MGTRLVKHFPCVGNLYVSTIARLVVVNTLFAIAEKDSMKDWHIIRVHPSDFYVNKFLELCGIKKSDKTGSLANCEVCRSMAKLKRSSHSNPLPSALAPFATVHMDVLQVTPVSQGSFKYILVLINDFSRFNRIYLLQKKSKLESKIMTFVKEIQKHLHVTPVILHTDRGGDFSSLRSKSFLSDNGISLEQGPANSPQTNGLAKRFNQVILVKMPRMLAQLTVPLNYWDKAARFALTLINMLPTSALDWKSSISVLAKQDKLIEQVRKVHTLLPFGLKVYVHNQNPQSKISPPLKPLLFLGYEPRSDAMQFLDPLSRRIVISCDFTPSILSFLYNSLASMLKLPSTLPNSAPLSDEEFVTINVPIERSARGNNLTSHAHSVPQSVTTTIRRPVTPATPPPTSSMPPSSSQHQTSHDQIPP
jgi:transposase InsO family protein